uniref:NSP5 n=1 Tax=Rotavirus G pigeon/HK18 TaxID=1399970 RepID=U3R085_9REOV|nr:NSP5 [Rotavirus G pigeon/HK18]WQF62283.1 MAG: NSP5 protein [Rotavirus G]
MAEVSEFDFNIKKTKKKIDTTTRQKKNFKMNFNDTATEITNDNLIETKSNYSEESFHTNTSSYSDAYNRLKKELESDESNDIKCKKTIENWAEEMDREDIEDLCDMQDTEEISQKISVKITDNMKANGDYTTEMLLNEISRLRVEIDVVKEVSKINSIDAAFNTILRNIDNLSTKQKHALVNAIVTTMK